LGQGNTYDSASGHQSSLRDITKRNPNIRKGSTNSMMMMMMRTSIANIQKDTEEANIVGYPMMRVENRPRKRRKSLNTNGERPMMIQLHQI
jgi:hypothetical protein